MRALALYYIIRATQEQKLDLRDWLVKMAYAEIMCKDTLGTYVVCAAAAGAHNR